MEYNRIACTVAAGVCVCVCARVVEPPRTAPWAAAGTGRRPGPGAASCSSPPGRRCNGAVAVQN